MISVLRFIFWRFFKFLENADIPLRYPDWIPVGRPEIPRILVAG
jgi:hypothetical protein